MLSGVGFSELALLFVIGLLILGPERLPRVASQLGRWVGKARRTANQLRFQMEREIALADIERTQSKKRKDDKQADATADDDAKSDSGEASDDSPKAGTAESVDQTDDSGTSAGDGDPHIASDDKPVRDRK